MKQLLYVGEQNAIARDWPCNAGIDEVLSSADRLFGVQRIDARNLSDEELKDIYLKGCYPSAAKHYAIRKVFGTGGSPALMFAKQVPALIVVDDAGFVEDIYPHDLKGKYVTIADALKTGR